MKRKDLTICCICDSRDIKVIDKWYDGLPVAICDPCRISVERKVEFDKMSELGRKLKYIMGDVQRRKKKKLPVSYQKGVIERIESVCKSLGIDTQREFRVDTGRIDLVLKIPQCMVAIEVERQERLAKDKLKITSIGKGAIVFDTYKDKIDEEFIKQLISSYSGIKVFV